MLFYLSGDLATHEPGDDKEEIATSQIISVRVYSAAELMKATNSFKQKGLRKGGYLGFITRGH